MQHSHKCPHLVGRHQVVRLVGFDLIDDADAAKSPFNGNDVAPMVATARGQGDFFKSGLLVRTSDNLLPFTRGNLECSVRVRLQQSDNLEPWHRDRFNQLSLFGPIGRERLPPGSPNWTWRSPPQVRKAD